MTQPTPEQEAKIQEALSLALKVESTLENTGHKLERLIAKVQQEREKTTS